MMKRALKRANLMLACLILSAFTGSHSARDVRGGCQPIETVPFCELTKHPERYADKVIRTSAIFLTHFPDVWFMYDEDCADKSNRVSHYLKCKPEIECRRLSKLSSLHRDGDGERWRNRIVVTGTLQIEQRQNRTIGSLRVLKFGIVSIESVFPVRQSVPWP